MKKRLFQVADYYGISMRKFEEKCHLGRGNISNLSDSGSIGSDKLAKIIDACAEVNVNWLITGDGPMLKTDTNFSSDTSIYEIPESIIKAPLIGQYANGGYLRGFADPVYLDEQPVFFSTRKHSGGHYVAFEVRGESMNDGTIRAISEGDILLGRELGKEHWWNRLHVPKVFIIVHRTEGITVKEVIEHDVESGRLRCHCWNSDPEYQDFDLYLSDIVQLFYVKEASRNVKY